LIEELATPTGLSLYSRLIQSVLSSSQSLTIVEIINDVSDKTAQPVAPDSWIIHSPQSLMQAQNHQQTAKRQTRVIF
jgi:hypothetical protein